MLKILVFILSLSISAAAIASSNYKEYASATFYHDYYQGRKMANGYRFSQNNLTGAHVSIPLGKKVKVTNTWNKKSVFVTITDRCRCHGIDLSKKAFFQLSGKKSMKESLQVGRISVSIEY